MPDRSPVRPSDVDPLAAEILERLRGASEAGEIVLGGYFALKHYLDYRPTHDIDAWWRTTRRSATMDEIRRAVKEVAGRRGMEMHEREWGDVASFELIEAARRWVRDALLAGAKENDDS